MSNPRENRGLKPLLSEEERTTLEALCLALFPPLAPAPGENAELFSLDAVARGVPAKVEETLQALGENERSHFQLFLRMLDQPLFIAFQTGRAARFAALPARDAERVLTSLATSRIPDLRAGFQAIRRLASFHHYTAIELPGPDPISEAIGYRTSANVAAVPSALRLTRIEADTFLDCDACVIGSGAGGSVAAAALATAGMSVIVLEAGSDWQSEEFDQREGRAIRELYLDRGTTSTRDLSVALLAGSALGGGTTVNWQTSLRTPEGVLAEWAQSSGCSHFAEDSFSRSLDAVCERLSVGVTESVANANNSVLREGCTSLGYDWSVIPRNARGCDITQCGNCVFGCRHGGKQSGAVTYLRDAQATGITRVIPRCGAERVVVERGRVSGVVATASTARGDSFRVKINAPIVVAACGSLHTPALLMRSSIRLRQLGRNLHLHPTTGIGALFDERIAAWEGPPQTVVCNEFAGLQGGYGFRIEVAPAHPGLIALATPWLGARAHRAEMQTSARKALLIVLVRDRSAGSVTVDRAGRPVVDYRTGSGEDAMLRQGMCRAARIVAAAGAKGIQTLHTTPLAMGVGPTPAHRFRHADQLCDAISRSPVGDNHLALFSAHQMGTCRMGRDPRTAVCDARGEVFGVKGLFIADASAFPGSSGVNPMISIMALAHHTASGIAAQ
ncbi:MAG TPA: GMC family oxidoreductase [Gemmatimonadaceae bacterium]|nr:GMC family oxidoreductase [Gemmatimonadaceae bacterium]